MWELLREADGVTQWDVGRCWKTWKYLRIFWSILYIYIYMIIYIYVCMIIFDYIYIYICMRDLQVILCMCWLLETSKI